MQTVKPEAQHQVTPNQAEKSQIAITNHGSDKKENMGSQNIDNSTVNEQKPKSFNIFSQTPSKYQTVNIFNQKPQVEQKKNIFANTQKSVNLFNISTVPQTGNSNIFKSSSKPLVKTLDDDEVEKQSSNGSSTNIVKTQAEFKSKPAEMIMKFNYTNPWTVMKSFNLKKFKNGVNSSKQFIYLTFEKHSQHGDKIHIFVRSRETKVILFQGLGIKGVSNKITNFMNKEQNLKFIAIRQEKKQNQDDKLPTLVREQLKIQLESIEDANNFKEFMTKQFEQQNKETENTEGKQK